MYEQLQFPSSQIWLHIYKITQPLSWGWGWGEGVNKVETHSSHKSPGSQMKVKLMFIFARPPSRTPESQHTGRSSGRKSHSEDVIKRI